MGLEDNTNSRPTSLRPYDPEQIGDRVARDALVRSVFDLDVRNEGSGREQAEQPRWTTFARLDETGGCVAMVEAAVLSLVLDGEPSPATAIRRAAVDPGWRGRGLLRELMTEALHWCDATPGPTLLYAAEPLLYERYGFRTIAQHRFVGPSPQRQFRPEALPIDPNDAASIASLMRGLEARAPVSRQCALVGAASMVLSTLRSSDDIRLVHAADLDATVAYELDDDTITLVDIVASAIPTMDELLARLPARPGVHVLFPPDQLSWAGTPIRDDTGLMLCGDCPAAMRRPFMLPPTAEF